MGPPSCMFMQMTESSASPYPCLMWTPYIAKNASAVVLASAALPQKGRRSERMSGVLPAPSFTAKS